MTQMPYLPHREPSSSGGSDIDFGRLFGMLLDHKWFIILVTALFFVGGVVYAALSTPIYQGDALVQVERRSSVSPLGDLDSIMGNEEANTSAEVEILRSRMVLGKVVDRTGLDTLVIPERVPYIGDYVRRNGIARPEPFSVPYLSQWGIDEIDLPDLLGIDTAAWGGENVRVGRFDVEASLRGYPFTLRVEDGDSYSLVQGERTIGQGRVGDNVTFLDGDMHLRVSEITAPAGVEFTLVKQTRAVAAGSLGARLGVSEQGASGGSSTGMLRLRLTGTDRAEIQDSLDAISEAFLMQNVERQSAQADQSLEFLEEQTPELRTKLNEAEERLNQYRVDTNSVDLNSESQSVVNQMIAVEQQLSDLELQEAELAQRFTGNHPSYRALGRQRAHLQEEREELNQRIDSLPAAQQEVVRLTRDVEVTQAIYVNLLNRAQELQVAKAGTIGNVRIIDDTVVGAGPIAPNKPVIVMLATVMGGFLSVAFVLARGFLNRGVENPEQLEELGLPVYATVPLSDAQTKLVKRIKHRRDKKSRAVIGGLLASTNPTDTAIEAMRGLRTSLHFAMLDAINNSIMITGPSPNVGKSFLSANLGAVCAQAEQRVLVIDADMRKGHIHHIFGDKPDNGLSDVLSGRCHWQKAIRYTSIEGLCYLSRGVVPPNPSELLMQERFSRFLQSVSPEFDLVIIDTPPILAVTDAAIVGKQVGTTLMVARFQLNPPREVNIALKRLENAGVEVKGCIMNALENKAAASYGYGYYHYTYS
ncbi:polysaccharide biosynthesis tyrosine autokinase [Aidingimonas lacisalsi]|uniref:polysaccharide biosynthesis tyrosine autokinase n=1 Tax=Aidingimonas lacisalsi TaxID=2604086 RepID=UPI001F021F9C|nr:polysaccharide biosynthesis tyrosine autokinase [Aidingimonas lacisalsi]